MNKTITNNDSNSNGNNSNSQNDNNNSTQVLYRFYRIVESQGLVRFLPGLKVLMGPYRVFKSVLWDLGLASFFSVSGLAARKACNGSGFRVEGLGFSV